MKEDVSRAITFPVTCHDGRGKYRRHPSWRLWEVPFWCVHHDQIPLGIIELIRERSQRQGTLFVVADRESFSW
uniref:Uncharacterized protein n=1 Tax=Arabidopsis thaliana TaxID=3702 RepID=Q0WPF8_ARATH|nr:hypothetical protein [Arabidopsis thaliana]